MKKPYWVTVIIPIAWGVLITVFAIWCFFNFVVNADDSQPSSATVLWILGIILGWIVAGLAPIAIGVSSAIKLSKSDDK